MIDLNPYFQRKLGETLHYDDEENCRTYDMEVIAVNDRPNAVFLEVGSRLSNHHNWCDKYHGVVEVDLNRVKSVRSTLETVFKTIQVREKENEITQTK